MLSSADDGDQHEVDVVVAQELGSAAAAGVWRAE